MPHKLASMFKSYTYDQEDKELKRDFLTDFDLTAMDPDGTIGPGCIRRPSGQPITGKVREIDPNPMGYQVEISQRAPFRVDYKGVAFFDGDQEVTRIAGFFKYLPQDSDDKAKVRRDLGLNVDQDEGTWVIIK